MKRISIEPRPDWEEKIKQQGFLFYKHESYYSETCAYEFENKEIDAIETATCRLFDMCLEVVDHIIKRKLWDEFFIPAKYAELIEWSWKEDQPSFYGRFDLAYNNGAIKLLEFNADTPTSLLESAVIQWHWLQDYNDKYDQFNSIHEKLLAHLSLCKTHLLDGPLHFSCVKENLEDLMNVKYMEDAAAQAGFDTQFVYIEDIGLDSKNHFVNRNADPIRNIFKLYPYEWMFHEEFGQYLIANREECYWIEPAYKAILSNKMLLKYLWDMFPNSEYILPCTFIKPGGRGDHPLHYVKKPVYSREGANVSIVVNGKVIEETSGDYGEEGYLYQEYFPLPDFDGNRPVIGSWLIGGQAAGMGIRECSGLITNNPSRFCSHYIKND